MTRRLKSWMTVGIAAAMFVSSLMAGDGGDRERGRDRTKFLVRAELAGKQEVPIVSTGASGYFMAVVDTVAHTIHYTLRYDGLEGSVQQAHVHIAQRNVNGGISFWLCSNLASPPTPAGTQACPTPGGTITGTVTPESVVGPTGQGIPVAAFAEVADALNDGLAYANIHSTVAPGGEIRGQLH